MQQQKNVIHPNLNNTLSRSVRAKTYPVYHTNLQAQSAVPQRKHVLGFLKYRPGSLGLDPDPCPGLSGPYAKLQVLVQHPEIDIGSPSPCWGKEEQNTFAHVLLMIRTVMPHNFGIPAYVDNPFSCAQADGNGKMLSASSGEKPRLGLGPDSRGLVPEIRTKQKSSASS